MKIYKRKFPNTLTLKYGVQNKKIENFRIAFRLWILKKFDYPSFIKTIRIFKAILDKNGKRGERYIRKIKTRNILAFNRQRANLSGKNTWLGSNPKQIKL